MAVGARAMASKPGVSQPMAQWQVAYFFLFPVVCTARAAYAHMGWPQRGADELEWWIAARRLKNAEKA
jgi:hypothetical protein